MKSTELASGDTTGLEARAAREGAPAAAGPTPSGPATAGAAAPAPPPGPHDPIVAAHEDTLAVAIAKTRKRPPFWATLALVALPIWALIYLNAVSKPGAKANDPLTVGGQLYAANCSSCHGSNGEGGVGPAFAGGAVVKTWPKYEDQITWVKDGTTKYLAAGHTTFGDGKTPINPAKIMPPFGTSLTEQQVAAVVYFERVQFGGEAPNAALAALATGGGGGGGG